MGASLGPAYNLEARFAFAGPSICGVELRRTCSKEAEQNRLKRTGADTGQQCNMTATDLDLEEFALGTAPPLLVQGSGATLQQQTWT